jgi:hypothetical protein
MAYMSQEHKKELSPSIKAILKKHNMKGSVAVRHHSTLVVNVQAGVIDFSDALANRGCINVNEYYIDEHYTGAARDFLSELTAAMKGPNYFDDSDAMTDYFHTSHYINVNIGQWNKPYVCTAIVPQIA